MSVVFYCLIGAAFVSGVTSRGNGAPCEALEDMTPKLFAHGPASAEPAPFEILILSANTEQAVDCYRENREYLVRIKPKDAGQRVAGFLIQPKDAGNKRVGAFTPNGGDKEFWKYQCPDNPASATHRSSERKSKVDLIWMTDRDVGPITFQATVVKDQYMWWSNILSKPFKSCRSDFAANTDPRSVEETTDKKVHCTDKLPSCSSWTHLCATHAFVFSYCRDSCNRCL